MVIIILTSLSSSHFEQYLNDEEMITSHLMCTTVTEKFLAKHVTLKP